MTCRCSANPALVIKELAMNRIASVIYSHSKRFMPHRHFHFFASPYAEVVAPKNGAIPY
jgi:hypothetical protein